MFGVAAAHVGAHVLQDPVQNPGRSRVVWIGTMRGRCQLKKKWQTARPRQLDVLSARKAPDTNGQDRFVAVIANRMPLAGRGIEMRRRQAVQIAHHLVRDQ